MKRIISITAAVLVTALTGSAEFTKPSDARLEQAAATPAQIAGLLSDASSEQAAEVVKAVILKILANHRGDTAAFQPGGTVESLIAGVIRHALSALPPDQWKTFASAMGTVCGNSPVINANGIVVSFIQGALATAGGNVGVALARSFATGFTAAATPAGSVGVQGQNQNQAPPPLRPPVATPYRGQR